jgi:hypothetical protein
MKIEKLGRVLLALFGLASLAGLVSGDEPGFSLPQSTADQARLQLASPLAAKQPTDARYRYLNGQWWYQLDDHRWAQWDGAKWTIPNQKADAYRDWRRQQFSQRYNRSEAEDADMRRREVTRWRSMASPDASKSLTQSDADYHKQMDRFHDTLSTAPYDYRIGTAGHGLFDCDPDRVIATSGRFNYATSSGGYMGGALRSPYGY